MSISIIAAVGKNNELGKNNDLIWHFREDMQFFKQTTIGSSVVMGRKTFESLPKALPKRRNIVITSNADYAPEGAEIAMGVEDAIDKTMGEKVFIIGGASIYKAFLEFADEIYLTEIQSECPDADTYFPDMDKSAYKREVLKNASENGIDFSFVKYTRV